MVGGAGGGGVITVHSSSPVFHSQRPRESAVGDLDGRQCQDAAVAGVEVLCVAPRPENRQQ